MTNATQALFAAISMLALNATAATAGEIALTFEQHGVTISGEFAGFQDDAYVLITTAGRLHVPANLATCEGDDCVVFFTADNG